MESRDEIPTPALLLDLDAFESNIATMAGHLAIQRRGFRPHGKTHKCPAIARVLIAAGAHGCCAAKLSEAEVFAAHGVRGLLITTPVVGPQKVARAVRLAATAPDTIFVVDDPQNVRDLNEAVGRADSRPPVPLQLAVDLYFGRTGIEPGEPALELARLIASLPDVAFAGLQAYDAAASHTQGFDARRARTRESMAKAVDTRRLLEKDGIACPMVSGGSTGTYNLDSEIDGMTEQQPGSFIFMDAAYRLIGGPGSDTYSDFQAALTVVTTVVSKRSGMAIVDGGYKAFSTDRPFGPLVCGLAGATYEWAGDEHGRLDLSHAERDVSVGDRVELVPPHCDPTINLYDRIYALRGDRVEDVWTIAARGMSQ